MARSLDAMSQTWGKTSIFKLEPEVIDKEIKTANSKALKLNGRFVSMKLYPVKAKGQQVEGPFLVLESLNNTIKEYQKNLPLIRVFSNQGMKERHWKEI